MIDSALIFNRNTISRTINELEKNLLNKRKSVNLEYEKIYSGIELSKVSNHQFCD